MARQVAKLLPTSLTTVLVVDLMVVSAVKGNAHQVFASEKSIKFFTTLN